MRFGTYAARSAELAPASAREVAQVFHVEADSPNVIFGAYYPETVFFPTGTIKVDPYGSLRAPYEIPEDSTYSVVSRVPNASPEQLRSAEDDYPEALAEKYTAPPPTGLGRTRALARGLTEGAASP